MFSAHLPLGSANRERPPAALPWEWFDFSGTPREFSRGSIETAEEGGARSVWRVAVDGRTVPFKVLRRTPPSGGRRPLVVMLHGMGLTIASFRGVAAHLLQSHDLALLDYSSLACHQWPAHDGWPAGGVAIRTMSLAVWAVADALETPRFSLAGNSLGGALCLIAALEKPNRVERLLLSNPACYPQALPRMYRLARVPLLGEALMAITPPAKFVAGIERIGYVVPQNFESELRMRYTRALSSRRNRFRLMDMIRHLPSGPSDLATAAHLPRLREIRQPVMLTWGLQDPLLVPGAGERLACDLPNCAYRPHADLAHMPHEEAPDRIGAEWVEFLKA